MSAQQAEDFVKGLDELTDEYKADSQTATDTFKESVGEAAQEFQDASHQYAAEMVQRTDQYVSDIKALYDKIYPTGDPNPSAY